MKKHYHEPLLATVCRLNGVNADRPPIDLAKRVPVDPFRAIRIGRTLKVPLSRWARFVAVLSPTEGDRAEADWGEAQVQLSRPPDQERNYHLSPLLPRPYTFKRNTQVHISFSKSRCPRIAYRRRSEQLLILSVAHLGTKKIA